MRLRASESLGSMKILVYQLRMLGDILLGTSAAEPLKRKYPGACLTYVTGCRALCETNPFIDCVIEKSLSVQREYLDFWLMRTRYAHAYHLHHWLPRPNMLQDFMAQCGLPRRNVPVRLYLTDADRRLAAAFLEGLHSDPARRIVAIQGDFDRKWDREAFRELRERLSRVFNVVPIGTGMCVGERTLNLREAAAVIERCGIFVGGISGLLHAAAAVGVPTVATPNAFDPRWDMPEFYQNEFIEDPTRRHETVRPRPDRFCGTYACVSLTSRHIRVRGGSFTPRQCAAGLPCGCIPSITAEQVFRAVQEKMEALR
jgi:ADP-heptose:LPS heptosyltransferase